MREWERFLWADSATEATVALVAAAASDATALLQRLGPTEDAGSMTFDAALEVQGSFYDDGSDDRRAVFQVDRLSGTRGEWWALLEPNGFRTSFAPHLLGPAQDGAAASFFWNVNAVMSLLSVDSGDVVTTFDPLIDVKRARQHAADLPFGDNAPAAAFALIERWTGVASTEAGFAATKPSEARLSRKSGVTSGRHGAPALVRRRRARVRDPHMAAGAADGGAAGDGRLLFHARGPRRPTRRAHGPDRRPVD